MFSINVDPKWVLERMGITADAELVELIGFLTMQLRAAPDKKAFLKDALRRALQPTPGNLRR